MIFVEYGKRLANSLTSNMHLHMTSIMHLHMRLDVHLTKMKNEKAAHSLANIWSKLLGFSDKAFQRLCIRFKK